MFGGGGGLDPRKMQQMMEQMGIDQEDLDVAEVVITLEDGEQLVFDDAEVMKIAARGQETYQVVGEPERREAGSTVESEADEDDAVDDDAGDAAIPEDDVELVIQRTGASEDEARQALEAEGGDLAAAIARLE